MSGAYPIPAAALDDRLGWVGTSGSGKTYNAGAGVELLLSEGQRAIVVDPLGVWWGLALAEDGRRPSLWRDRESLVIFGGDHGDLPLTEQAGALIGETVATMAESAIVDLSGLGTKASEIRFMLAFLTALYRRASGSPVHLVFDEADMWAPQQEREKGEGPKLLGMMETVIRRGRVRGFIPWLISQRPAVLNKNVLAMVDGLVAFKLTSSQDRDAIGDWVKGQADLDQWRQLRADLPTMQRGQGLVWVPARGLLATAQFPAKATFDSSRTPERGERQERRDLKPLDLGKLKDKLSSLEEEVRANDPKQLKLELSRLRVELDRARKAALTAPPAPPPVVANAEEIEAARQQGRQEGVALGIAQARAAIDALGGAPVPKRGPTSKLPPVEATKSAPVTSAEGLTGPQQRILNALAWWRAFGIDQPSSEQLAFVAGYSASSSGYANLKGGLRSIGLLDYPAPGKVALTEAGDAKAELPDTPVNQGAFHAAVMAKLSDPQRRLLTPLMEAWPESLSSAELASRAGYSASSSGFANLRGQMRSLGFVDYPASGLVRAEDWLFPEGTK